MPRLIDANELKRKFINDVEMHWTQDDDGVYQHGFLATNVYHAIDNAPIVNAIVIPKDANNNVTEIIDMLKRIKLDISEYKWSITTKLCGKDEVAFLDKLIKAFDEKVSDEQC